MSEKRKTTVVVLHETIAESIVRDVVSFMTLGATVGLGWALDSSAMQWVAAVLWSFWVLARATRLINKNTSTPQEAADMLARKFGVTARQPTVTTGGDVE